MPDKSDIMKNPDQVLAVAVCGALSDDDRLQAWVELHLHLLAGGPLPAQWRGEGTAVGELIADAQRNADTFESLDGAGNIDPDAAAQTRAAIYGVTGEG